MQAIWTNDHALAWHLEEDFRRDPVGWAHQQCLAWEQVDDEMPNFLQELPDCPCTLAQARADTGRFHVSPPLLPHQGPAGVGDRRESRAGCRGDHPLPGPAGLADPKPCG